MKKLVSCILAFLCVFSAVSLSACKVSDEVVIAAPDGAPVLALYSIMADDTAIGGKTVGYKVYTGAANIGTAIASGDADVAVMPLNVAAKLYNAGQKIKLLSVNVFGVLYMVGKDELASVASLEGKRVVTIGRGGSPDLMLKYVLDKNGVEYEDSETVVEGKVAINYVNAATDANQLIAKGKADYAILGEPVATTSCAKLNLKVVLDIQEEWAKIVGENSFTQAGVVVSEKIYSNESFCTALLSKLSENADYAKNNAENVKAVVNGKGSALAMNFTRELIENCNLGCVRASTGRETIEKYFSAILEASPEFIGGKLPNAEFYY